MRCHPRAQNSQGLGVSEELADCGPTRSFTVETGDTMPSSLMDPISSGVVYEPSLGRTSSVASPAWRGAMACALAGSVFSLLLMGLGTHKTFSLNAEDAVFGNGCGGSPPSVSQIPMLAALVSQSSVRAIRDNATSTPDGSSSSYKSKGDGAACASTSECVGVCAGYTGGTGGTAATGRCMLAKYGGGSASDYIMEWVMFDGFAMIWLFLTVAVILTAREPLPAARCLHLIRS